jgi:hypothetical protein
MHAAISFTSAEIALLRAAKWELEDGDHHEVSEHAFQTFWGMGGFPCPCCNFSVDAILTKYDDGTIVGTFSMVTDKPPWATVPTVEAALEAYKTADYFS